MPHTSTLTIQNFISRWKASGASERANYQLFLTELCELLGVEKPQPATDKVHEASYTFERPVVFDDGEGKTSTNFIDLYKKDCFVLEAKQGSDKAGISEAQQEQIRSIAEQLDAHRKQRQAQHPTLTITDMYNVLEKLRSGETLTPKEQKTHEQGLVSILLQLHQELDAAVAAAYGWPANLSEEEILERLVALNKERAAEEARGHIRWLRPAYQNPQGTQQGELGMESKKKGKAATATAKEQLAWPKNLSEQAQAVQRALQLHERPATAQELLQQFKSVAKAQQPQRLQQIDSLLQTLHGLGLLRKTEQEQYVK